MGSEHRQRRGIVAPMRANQRAKSASELLLVTIESVRFRRTADIGLSAHVG